MKFTKFISKAYDVILISVFAFLSLLYLSVFSYTVLKDFWYTRLYIGFLAGMGIYILALIIPRFRYNFRWWMKFTHELTHTLVAIVFFRKVKTFVVNDRECYVSYSGGPIGYIPITLSPYCVPLFTLMLLPFRYMGNNDFMQTYDILLGFTYAFHIHSFILQTRPYQSDIENCGRLTSAVFIAFAHLFFASLILATVRGGVKNGIMRAAWEYPCTILKDPAIVIWQARQVLNSITEQILL